MSWSVQILGKPEKIIEKMETYSAQLTGQSKTEFDEVLPHLSALIRQAVGDSVLLNVSASGHARFDGNTKVDGTISVAIQPLYTESAL